MCIRPAPTPKQFKEQFVGSSLFGTKQLFQLESECRKSGFVSIPVSSTKLYYHSIFIFEKYSECTHFIDYYSATCTATFQRNIDKHLFLMLPLFNSVFYA